jgi:hypothetical protein
MAMRHEGNRRSSIRAWLGTVGIAALVCVIGSGTAWAASVTPSVVPGNSNEGKTCAVLFPGTTELKKEGVNSNGEQTVKNFNVSSGGFSIDFRTPSVTVGVLPNGNPLNNSLDFTANAGATGLTVLGVIVKDGEDGANTYDYRPAGILADTYLTTPVPSQRSISHVSFCIGAPTTSPLTATKTAAGTYDRTITWTLEKDVNGKASESFTGQPGSSFPVNWNVIADKNETLGNHQVIGSITIKNSNNIAVPFTVTDELNDAATTDATVICPETDNNTGTVPAASGGVDGEVTCTYTATPSDATATLNTATVTSGNPSIGNPNPQPTATITWTENVIGYPSGTLSDPRFSYSELISGDTSKTFPETFVCPPRSSSQYVNDKYEFTVVNNAYLNGSINLQDSASVTVTCLKVQQASLAVRGGEIKYATRNTANGNGGVPNTGTAKGYFIVQNQSGGSVTTVKLGVITLKFDAKGGGSEWKGLTGSCTFYSDAAKTQVIIVNDPTNSPIFLAPHEVKTFYYSCTGLNINTKATELTALASVAGAWNNANPPQFRNQTFSATSPTFKF